MPIPKEKLHEPIEIAVGRFCITVDDWCRRTGQGFSQWPLAITKIFG